MKQFFSENRYVKVALAVIFVICSIIIFEKILSNIGDIVDYIFMLFRFVRGLLTPFIYGFTLAYLINPAVRSIEANMIGRIPFLKARLSLKRFLSAIITYIIVIGCVVWIVAYLIPEITSSIKSLVSTAIAAQANMDSYYYSSEFFNSLLDAVNETFSINYTFQDVLNLVFDPLMRSLSSLPDIVNTVLTGTFSAASVVLNLLIGTIVSFYMICDKESIQAAIVKFLRAMFSESAAERIIRIAKSSNLMFERFFVGKIIDSTIIGFIFFIICLFIKPPYTVLLTLIVGVTNMIPYFGPWFGGFFVAIIVLLKNPIKTVWVIIAILILQQVDGTIIGPRILGSSTGQKPLDIIFAITVGGALFGVVGMFLGVPFYAVLKSMLAEIINRRYNKKFLVSNADLPDDEAADGGIEKGGAPPVEEIE